MKQVLRIYMENESVDFPPYYLADIVVTNNCYSLLNIYDTDRKLVAAFNWDNISGWAYI